MRFCIIYLECLRCGNEAVMCPVGRPPDYAGGISLQVDATEPRVSTGGKCKRRLRPSRPSYGATRSSMTGNSKCLAAPEHCAKLEGPQEASHCGYSPPELENNIV